LEFAPQSKQLQQLLERGEADLLINPAGYTSPDHPRESLYRENFVRMVWRDGPLARGPWNLERDVGAEHVVIQPVDGRVDIFDEFVPRALGCQPQGGGQHLQLRRAASAADRRRPHRDRA
jgi:DNA-binding transcriptional LysR family regulator